MKTARLLIAMSLLSLIFGGCASAPSTNQLDKILSATLPKTYVGDANIRHHNAYFDFAIVAKNLRFEGDAWRCDSISYERNGRFSTGTITLGK